MSSAAGRLREPLPPLAREIVMAPQVTQAIEGDLRLAVTIDRAHLVMLVEGGVLAPETGRLLLRGIRELESGDFAALAGRPAPRGWYLMYEGYLIERLGPETGGLLQLGRSRNDLSATLFRMKLRSAYAALARETLGLQACLLRLGRRYAGTVMPAYTHHQAAVPITYGHYLAGVANALDADLGELIGWADELGRSPLGAGAVGGTGVEIRSARTAELLGFTEPIDNSVAAVASRDLVLRLLSACTVSGVLLSRVATDLLTWTSAEFDFFDVPDRLAGSSSMMPQKRNLFLLEHVQGKAAAPLGAFVTGVTAMHKAPFTNSIAVHTEAVHGLWEALRASREAAVLLRMILAGIEPRPERMLARAESGFITATELATRMARERGIGFRAAHARTGALVNLAVERGQSLAEVAEGEFGPIGAPEVVAGAEYGGGPGARSLRSGLVRLRESWAAGVRRLGEHERRWREAADTLERRSRELEDGRAHRESLP